jgi:hypothetical protein
MEESRMKKIMLTIFTMLLMMGVVFAQDLQFEPQITEESEGLESFVVIGGDTGTGDQDVIRGEVLNDVKLLTKFTIDAYGYCEKLTGSEGKYASRLDVYAQIGTAGAKYPIKSFYAVNAHKTGDVVNYKITGIDTEKFPTSFSNQGITIGATHYACYTAQIPEIPKWTKDDSWYGAYRGTNDAFAFVEKDNLCEKKLLRKECDVDRVVTVYQSVTLDSNGECLEKLSYGPACDKEAQTCHNGVCISTIDIGTKRCANDGKIIQNWEGKEWSSTICMQDGKGYCTGAGECNIPPPPVEEKDETGNDEPFEPQGQDAKCDCTIDDEQLVQNCWDGTQISEQICDGCYMIPTNDKCPVAPQGEPKVITPIEDPETGALVIPPTSEEEPVIPTPYLIVGGAAILLILGIFKDQIMGKKPNKKRK